MKRGLILLFLAIHSLLVGAQGFYCKTIGIAEGLSQSSVTSIIYDEESSLWIGTRYGLNEYRGNKMRVFKENYINDLFIDSSKKLWVSTDEGLSYYDGKSDSFIPMLEDQVYSAIDYRGHSLFGSAHGVYEFDNSSSSFNLLYPADGAYVIDMFDYDGRLLVVDRGLGIFLDGMTDLIDIPALKGKVIMDSVLDGNTLYLATFREGLFVYDLSDGSCRNFNSSNSGLTFDVVLSLLLADGCLWMGTDGGGICIYDKGEICSFSEYFNYHTGVLPDNSITTLYQDPHGNVWAGSVRSGLFGFKKTHIKTLSLSQDVVISIYEDSDGIVWVGMDGGGLNRYDPSDGTVDVVSSMDGEKVVSICDYDRNTLLLSLYSKGYCLVDKSSGRRRPFVIVDTRTNAEECFNGNAPCNYLLDDGRILILAINVYVYDVQTRRFSRIQPDSAMTVSGLKVIGDDHHGKIYAVSSMGLYEIDTDELKVHRLLEMSGINTASYINRNIWIGTDAGIKRLVTSSETLFDFDTPLFSRVTQICPDAENGLWIAADNTLFKYKGGRFEQYGENEGFAPNEVLCYEFSSNDRSIYLGGTKGMVEINTSGRHEDEITKHFSLHEMNVNGNRYTSGDERIVLPHNFGMVSLSVNLSSTDPFEKVLYRYVIEGTNMSVFETYDDNIQLYSLTDGRYVVKASYLMNGGVWSPEEDIVRFKVNKPWYKSKAFNLILIFIALGGIVFGFVVLYRIKVRKYEQSLRAVEADFIRKLDTYIEENLSNPEMDVLAMAEHFAMSRAALYNKVKRTTGKAVAEYIMEKRMEAAKELLRNSSLSITDISERVGFSSQKYFSTCFKRINGCTPNVFRKQ